MSAYAEYRGLFLGLAEHLKRTFGSQIHFYCGTRDHHGYYAAKSRDGLFASINSADQLYTSAAASDLNASEVITEAQRNERELGITYNELLVSDRHFGRGYALGGYYHPRSRLSDETSYLQILNGLNSSIRFWHCEFEDKSPTLLIHGSKVAAVVSRYHGVPIRMLASSRVGHLHYWAHNEYLENPQFEAAFERIEHSEPTQLSAPYVGHLQNRTFLTKQGQLGHTLKRATLHVLRRYYGRMRGFEQARNYYLNAELRYIWRVYRQTGAMQRRGRPLVSLQGERFVFFPLHTEPETALQMLSPEFFFQLSAIAALSRDLPAGVKLAVKEALFAVGRRPRNFYDQISEFKNVVWLDPREMGLDVIRACDAVATITGTAGFEAASMGKPVISFGQHNLYNFLPHAFVVQDNGDLKPRIRDALSVGFDSGAAHLAGARFLACVKKASFDLGDFSILNPEVASDQVVENSFNGLVTSLTFQAGEETASVGSAGRT